MRACVSCHGQNGRGISNVYFPRLAGKPAGYLYNQLVAFREGRWKYATMNYLLAYLPDKYLMKMTQYYADIQVPYDNPAAPAASQSVLQHGRSLVTNGDPARQIPACIACHGPNLGGREPGIPALIGLRTDYISAQLGAWRYGNRTALEPDCMQLVAAALNALNALNGFALWLTLMIALTVVNYSYPIIKLMTMQETSVPAVPVGVKP